MAKTASRRLKSRSHGPAELLRAGFIALLPIAACFLGGATAKWAEGIIVALLGLYVVFSPPRNSLGWALNFVLLAIIASTAAAFLPARWFFEPAWRTTLAQDFDIALPATLSAQPFVTLGCMASFAAALVWFYVVATNNADPQIGRLQLRLFAGGIALLAAASIVFYFTKIAPPFWINERRFGPFPNRNQTADLFGVASVIVAAVAHDDFRNRRKTWIAWLIAFAIVAAAVVLNFSRAGVLLVVVGNAVWVGLVAIRRGSPARVAAATSFVLLLLAALLVGGGQTLERFHLRSLTATGVPSDFRWLIFRDAWQLIRASPWCGFGLGNFEHVFAMFRQVSPNDSRALHPESDWLWLLSEAGWSTVGLVTVALVLVIPRVWPLKSATNQRLRLAALIGALLTTLHGFIDVSGHRVGTAYAAIFLLGFALYRPAALRESQLVRGFFVVLGLALIATGATWTYAFSHKSLLPGAIGAENARELATATSHSKNFPRVVELTTRALAWTPLDWRLYFVRAIGDLGTDNEEAAADDFRRVRFLEPNALDVAFDEGKIWLPRNGRRAVVAWREALRRAGARRAEVFDSMLSLASMQNRAVVPDIVTLSLPYPELLLVNLRRLKGEAFTDLVARFRERDSDLITLTAAEQQQLFRLWTERGQPNELEALLSEVPQLLRAAWPTLAEFRAKAGDYRGAVQVLQQQHGAVPLPDIQDNTRAEELQRRIANDPRNFAAGFALYQQQIGRGDVDGALDTARHFTALANAPAYFNFLEGECWTRKDQWDRAWTAYSTYLSKTPPK